jgi:hypothetical protein
VYEIVPEFMCAFFARWAKNRAIRSKSSGLHTQALRDFRFYPLRPTGGQRAARPCNYYPNIIQIAGNKTKNARKRI